jgi:prepilin-type processing-associated H-X9-DG protein
MSSGVRKSLSAVQRSTPIFDAFCLQETVIGPSQIWLIPPRGDDPSGRQNFPDPQSNHGADRANVLYCDGHGAWIPTMIYLFRYELSQAEQWDQMPGYD